MIEGLGTNVVLKFNCLQPPGAPAAVAIDDEPGNRLDPSRQSRAGVAFAICPGAFGTEHEPFIELRERFAD